ncbi:MAG TPA: VCBS repeat-containing protein [Pyrinomonadaceae bacterium]|jgi:hypothetical protein
MSETIQRTVVKFTLVRIFAFVLLVCFSTNSVLAVVCPCTSALFPSLPTDYPVGSGPQRIETGDFNSDGKLDLITANYDTNSVSLILGTGTGGFGSPTNFALGGTNPQAIVVADFDQDGKSDFATSNNNSDSISVGYNTSNNGVPGFYIVTFSTRDSSTPNTPASPRRLTTGNFVDSAGGPDIATCNGQGTVSVFKNIGITFAKLNNFQLSGSPDLASIRTANFNNDGFDDIITTQGTGAIVNPNPIYVMLNGAQPDGIDRWKWDVKPKAVNSDAIYNSITGDFDNDGKADDLVAGSSSQYGGNIRVYLGNTDGSLTEVMNQPGFNNYFGGGLKAADFNLDGRLDIAAAGGDRHTASITVFFALNLGGGQLGDQTSVSLGPNRHPLDAAVGDFNNDGKPDAAFPLATTNTAAVFLNTHNENAISKTDYNRNGGTDYAVWRPSVGDWYILDSFFPNDPNKQINYHFGASGDIPVQGDYDGDKKTDFAVFRLNNNTWYILHSSSNGPFVSQLWGASNDKLVPGDYDGDCKTDIAIYRPTLGLWCIIQSSNGAQQYIQFGTNNDIPVQGDYDSDGKTDLAVFRPSNNTWYIQRSTAGFFAQQWGASQDKAVPGDYDGDCKTDIAVFRPSTGGWHIIKSSGGFLNYQVGISTDTPQQGDYDGDGKTDAAIWRSTTGDWWVLKSSHFNIYPFNLSTPPPPTVQNWGANGDIPTASIYPIQ